MDYSKFDTNKLQEILAGEHPDAWLAAARAWGKMAVAADNVGAGISGASGEITVWRQSNDSAAQRVFDGRITRDLQSLTAWANYGRKLTVSLQTVGDSIGNARVLVQHWVDERKKQVQKVDSAKNDSERYWANLGVDIIDYEAQKVVTQLAGVMSGALSDKDAPPARVWLGPRAVADGNNPPKDPPPGDPNAGTGTGAGTGAAGGAGGGPADAKPAETPAATPKTPAEKDPWDEAGKVIDVVGKGIGLVGKVPDNLDKWLTLAQHGKDLLGTTTTPDPGSVKPDGIITDRPALAGTVGTAPTFNPTHFTTPSTGGDALPGLGSIGGGGGLPSIGKADFPTGTTDRGASSSSRAATTAGATGAEPTLAGKAATSPAGGKSTTSPPMYPPMSGMGAGGNNSARSEIRPGTAASRPGFAVPAESTASERLRRHGVQSDLQGRTSGERRTPAGAPPLRKRAQAGKTPNQDVLDEELWKP
jgi:hypothetical protein